MSKTSLLLFCVSIAALGVGLYALMRAPDQQDRRAFVVEQPVLRVSPAEQRVEALEAEVDALKAEVARLRAAVGEVGNGPARPAQPDRGNAIPLWLAPEARVDSTPQIPANQVAATQRLHPISDEALATLVESARRRVPEQLTPVTPADFANMVNAYEWGIGTGRRIWRQVDGAAYHEVYSDGSYSVLPILGRATVNGAPGVMLIKDDGVFDVFVPDKGNKMVHMIRPARTQAPWMEYRQMENVE